MSLEKVGVHLWVSKGRFSLLVDVLGGERWRYLHIQFIWYRAKTISDESCHLCVEITSLGETPNQVKIRPL